MTLSERFWAKVDKNGPIPAHRPDLGPCFVWTGAEDGKGYGIIGATKARNKLKAHRVAYELLVGPVPEGLELDHLCWNRGCVNPAHLEPVTRSENLRRGEQGRKTHCKHGHPYDALNTYVDPRGKRRCRACKKAAREAVRALRS